MKILYIDAAVKNESRTRMLADYLASKLDGEIKRVNLEELNLKPLDQKTLEKRTKLIMAGAFYDEMFDLAKDFKDADIIIISAPHWDLSFPSSLKVYFEHISIIDLVFRYNTRNLSESLCNIKKMYYVTTAGGGIYDDSFSYGYIKSLFNNFYGVSDTNYIKAEGLDLIGANVDEILNNAKKEIDLLLK